MKKSERKGRRSFDTAIEYGTMAMVAREKTRTAKAAVRATNSHLRSSLWSSDRADQDLGGDGLKSVAYGPAVSSGSDSLPRGTSEVTRPPEAFSRLYFPAGHYRNRFLTFVARSRSLVSIHEFQLSCSDPHAAWPFGLRPGRRGAFFGSRPCAAP